MSLVLSTLTFIFVGSLFEFHLFALWLLCPFLSRVESYQAKGRAETSVTSHACGACSTYRACITGISIGTGLASVALCTLWTCLTGVAASRSCGSVLTDPRIPGVPHVALRTLTALRICWPCDTNTSISRIAHGSLRTLRTCQPAPVDPMLPVFPVLPIGPVNPAPPPLGC